MLNNNVQALHIQFVEERGCRSDCQWIQLERPVAPFQVPSSKSSCFIYFFSFFWLYCFFEFIQGLYFCCHFNPIFILNFSRICIYLLICNLVHSGFNYPWQQESTQGHFGNSFLYFTYIPCSTSGINMLCYVL